MTPDDRYGESIWHDPESFAVVHAAITHLRATGLPVSADEPILLPFPADRPRDVLLFPVPATAPKTPAFAPGPTIAQELIAGFTELGDALQAEADADDDPEDTPLHVEGEPARPAGWDPAEVFGLYEGA